MQVSERMLKTELQLVLQNIHAAETDDLMDRVTAYRAGMEPEVVGFIEDELDERGVTPQEIAAHAECCRRECIFHEDGTALMCSFCRKPAVAVGWGWHRLFQATSAQNPYRFFLPGWILYHVFRLIRLGYPRYFHHCAAHLAEDR